MLTVRLPEDLMDALGAASRRTGVTRHAFVRAVLEDAAGASAGGSARSPSSSALIRARLAHDVVLGKKPHQQREVGACQSMSPRNS